MKPLIYDLLNYVKIRLLNSQAPWTPGMTIGPVFWHSSLSLARLKTAKNDPLEIETKSFDTIILHKNKDLIQFMVFYSVLKRDDKL